MTVIPNGVQAVHIPREFHKSSLKRSLIYVQVSTKLFMRCQHSKAAHRILQKKMVHGTKKIENH